jgi:hypothetical protein
MLQLFSMIKSEGGIKRTGYFFWSVVNFSFEKDIIGHIFTGQYYGLHMQGLLKKNEKKLARSFNFFLIISISYQFKDDQLCSNCTNSHHVYYTDDTAVKYINGNITLANNLNLDIYKVMFYHLKHGRFKLLSIPIELNCKHHRLFIIIILCSGDISLKPGPIKYPCGKCYKPVAKNHRAIFCEVGNQWWHIQCANVTPQEYKDLEQNSDLWICNLCNNFNFSESFFDTSLDLSHSSQEIYMCIPKYKQFEISILSYM